MTSRLNVIFLALVVVFTSLQNQSLGKDPSIGSLEEQFQQLPSEARRLTGPLFWLHGDNSKELLEEYVGKVAEGGNGCFTAESRPHTDWLGEGWYRDLDICLQAAKKHDLKMWIFDEKWWPSGEVGGMVPEKYASKRMTASAKDVTGPSEFIDDGYDGNHYIGTVAGKETANSIDGDSLMDLSKFIKNGRLQWNAPEGKWKVIRFGWELSNKDRLLVDGASADCAEWLIQTVYQPHYDRFKKDFGKSIQGFFYDEPETRGDWGTEVMKVLKERKVDWKKALVACKFKLAGEQQAAARYQYQDAFAEAWGRTLFGGITKWCHDHDVLSIGHFLEHRMEYLHPEVCAGNMFQLQKYTDFGGIDAVFDQFIMGKRVARDAPTWQTPKIASSISHVYGKDDDIAMVEIFGARGQDLSYPEMKWWTDHMHVSGVNFHIPHSFNPRSPFDMDCPPYFYNNGYEPRWPLYRVYADYTSRLTLMLTGGRHVCPVALLFLGGSHHVGKSVPPEQISTALQDALYDCDWMPYEVLEKDATIKSKQIRLYQERYSVLIVPPVEVIPYKTLSKVKEFFDKGGIVVGYGFVPTKSATLGRTSEDIQKLCKAIWGAPKPGLEVRKTNKAGGRSYLLPLEPTPEQLQQVLAGDAGIHPTLEVLEGDTNHWLHVLHRFKSGCDIFFVCNQDVQSGPKKFRFKIKTKGHPECWDAVRNEIRSIPYIHDGEHVKLSLTLESNDSALIVCRPKKRELPMMIQDSSIKAVRSISIVRDETPEQPVAVPEMEAGASKAIADCKWVWYPQEEPAVRALVGTCYFRKNINIEDQAKITDARFIGTADNTLALFVNGKKIDGTGQGFDSWNQIANLEIGEHLKAGKNTIAISVYNASDQPNPAGLIGKIIIEYEEGKNLVVAVDKTWKTSDKDNAGWQGADFDDSKWVDSIDIAAYGQGPWWTLSGRQLTLSPIRQADPFFGHCVIPGGADLSETVVYLEADEIGPEPAARVTINGQYAGGFIARPFRLDVTQHLKAGKNTICIEPFAPASAKLVLYKR